MRLVFGGTFDPVHVGHLRMAIELACKLSLDSVYLMPCFQAVHKDAVSASAEQRLEMLRLSIVGESCLKLDEREVNRGLSSYTVESLKELRDEIGDEPLCIVMGRDAAINIDQWYKASSFSSLTHVIVLDRPDEGADHFDGLDAVFLGLGFEKTDSTESLVMQSAGQFMCVSLSSLQISSTYIRESIRGNKSIRFLVADAVNAFICDNGLYSK
jgi:nicotinate-nucleotide adenylyltransferase